MQLNCKYFLHIFNVYIFHNNFDSLLPLFLSRLSYIALYILNYKYKLYISLHRETAILITVYLIFDFSNF